jgi:hypothetical protein
MKKKNKISIYVIIIIALIAVLSIFIWSAGLRDTFKYFLLFIVILSVSYGVSVWLNRKWISYLPTAFFAGFAVFFSIMLVIAKNDDGLGRGLYVVLIIAAIFLCAISFLSAILVDHIVSSNEPFEIQLLAKDYKEYIVLAFSIIMVINNISKIPQADSSFDENVPGILLAVVIIFLIYSSITLCIYFLSHKKVDIFKASLLIFIIYILFSYLIQIELLRILLTIGVSFGLAIIQTYLIIANLMGLY